MAILTKMRRQTATYWGPPSTPDGYGGGTYPSPVLLNSAASPTTGVRWSDKAEVFVNGAGQEKTSLAIVYTGQDVEVGGWLALGNQTATAKPESCATAHRIQRFDKIPNLKASAYLRKAYL